MSYLKGEEINYQNPVLEEPISQKVQTELERAWQESILVDNKGWMWVTKLLQ